MSDRVLNTLLPEAAVSRCSENRCSWKLRNIHGKTPVLEPLFNKIACLQDCNFIKNTFQHRCFCVTKFFKTAFSIEHLRWHISSNNIHGQIRLTLCSTYLLNYKDFKRCFLTICFLKLCIVIRNGEIVWKVVWIEYYLWLSLSCQRY